ncbi:MAG: hypothetical protein ACFE0P_07850 [Oceanicaulis sp.]
MTRTLILAALALTSLTALAACGRNDAPDTPIYTIDQSVPAAAPDAALAGCWSGVITTGAEPRPVLLEVGLDPAEIRLISPDQGGAAVPLEQVRLDGARLAAATRLGAFRFEGALEANGVLSGDVVQGGLRDTLTLEMIGQAC